MPMTAHLQWPERQLLQLFQDPLEPFQQQLKQLSTECIPRHMAYLQWPEVQLLQLLQHS